MLQLKFPKVKSIFQNKKIIEVFGEGGTFLNIIGGGLILEDFEFGQTILFNNPHEPIIRKEENNLQFAHTFPGSSLAVIWSNETSGGTLTVANNLLTLNAQGAGEDAIVKHRISLQQNIFGDMVFEARVRRNADSGSPACFIGLSSDPIDTANNYVYFRLTTDNTTWLPTVRRSLNIENGTPFTIPNNDPVTLKIVLTTGTAKFYADDILKETITDVDVPDDRALYAILGVEESGGDGCKLEVAWVKLEYGV